jgi:hypothetical protein
MRNIKAIGLFFLMTLLLVGCLRINGSAGYWKQGTEDNAPEVHAAGFDTAKLIPARPVSK